jgi:hypothetical protein
VPVHLLDGHRYAARARALLTVHRVRVALLALAAGVALAVLIGWAVLGWSTQLLLPVGVVVAAWAVGEVVRLVLDQDRPRG